MLNRRLLRIKAFQALYGYFREETADAQVYRKKMLAAPEKTYELYIYLLSFLTGFTEFLEKELETERGKYIPSQDTIQSLEILTNQKVIAQINADAGFQKALKEYKISWDQSNDTFRKIWNEWKQTEALQHYLAKGSNDYQAGKQYLQSLLEWVCADNELFDSWMEDHYLNWEDDQVLALTTLQKTFQLMKPGSREILPAKHKDEKEDMTFIKELFDLCLKHDEEFTELISARTRNWDQDRIAQVDLILMKMALCEVLYFPYIPVKVSINEYLELAKLYSTPQSHGFINGILDKIQTDLRKENRIRKQGRGLVE